MTATPIQNRDIPGTLAGFLAQGFDRLVAGLAASLDRLEADPLDEEAVHDARVACRRLRVGVRLVRAHVTRRKRVKRLVADLRALRTALGAARETEVALSTLATLRPEVTGDVRLAADALSATLAVRHEELRREAGPALAALGLPRFRRRLERMADALRGAAAEGESGIGDPHLATLELIRAAGEAVQAARAGLLALPSEPIAAGEDAALHRLRIEGKKLRYTLEFFEPLYQPRLRARLRMLRQLQDQLGAIHDLADLRRRLNDLAAAARRLQDGRLMIGYEALGALVDRERGRRLAGVGRLQAAVSHPGFVPPAAALVAGAVAAGRHSPGAPQAEPAEPDAAAPAADEPREAAGGDS